MNISCDFKEKNPFSEVDDWLDTIEMPYKFYENSLLAERHL